MKQAHPLQILGAPAATEHTTVCPSCSGQAQVNEDGSLLCPTELRFFEPEPSCPADSEFVAMRQKFDDAIGIDVAARLTIPLNVLTGVAFDRLRSPGRKLTNSAAA
jgi:hypothetical protein